MPPLRPKYFQILRKLGLLGPLLPLKMRFIAKLRFKDEKSIRDISEKVNRPMGAISSTLYRIRQKLFECVTDKLVLVEAEMDFKKS